MKENTFVRTDYKTGNVGPKVCLSCINKLTLVASPWIGRESLRFSNLAPSACGYLKLRFSP